MVSIVTPSTYNVALGDFISNSGPFITTHCTDVTMFSRGIAVVKFQIPVLIIPLTAPCTAIPRFDCSQYVSTTLLGSHSRLPNRGSAQAAGPHDNYDKCGHYVQDSQACGYPDLASDSYHKYIQSSQPHKNEPNEHAYNCHESKSQGPYALKSVPDSTHEDTYLLSHAT